MKKKEVINTNNTLIPFITVQDVMKVFSCKKDKAYAIMRNPDLEAFKVGKTIYVTQEKWERFINDIIKYNGLQDLNIGFH